MKGRASCRLMQGRQCRRVMAVPALFVLYFVVLAGLQLLQVAYSYVRGFDEEVILKLQDVMPSPWLYPEVKANLADGTMYKSPGVLWNRSADLGVLSAGNASFEYARIPKILHRTWKNSNLSTMPNYKWLECFDWCKMKHPGWTHVLWTDEDGRELVKQQYPWFLEDYDSYTYPIQRVDALRYFIVHHYGGVYMDMDIACRRTLDELTDSVPPGVALLPITTPVGLSNDVLLAPANHPFFSLLINSLRDSNHWYGLPYLTVFFSAGPSFLTSRYMFGAKEATKNVRIMSEEVLIGLDESLETTGGFFRHVVGSSWHAYDAKAILAIKDAVVGLAQRVTMKNLFVMVLGMMIGGLAVAYYYRQRRFGGKQRSC